jgi:hypothetical protein
MLKTGLTAGASYLVLGRNANTVAESVFPAQPQVGTDHRILPLTSCSDVYIPPRGESFLKFSFDFPEPSVVFGDLLFSFRIYTFENTYGLDQNHLTMRETPDGLDIECSQFVWAGGQQTAPGKLRASVRKQGGFTEWSVVAEMDLPIKSIATILRGVPRGKVSVAGNRFFDPKDNELQFGHPYLFGGMTSPLVVIEKNEQEYFFLSLLHQHVRASRLYFQPGDKGYRTELIYEQEGWVKSKRIETPTWRVGQASSLAEAARPHFAHLEQAYGVPDWATRKDVPDWARNIDLVVALHGMHWTGYIFNDYAKMQRTLEWVATKIPAQRVLVFLPAWDGRYYWNYPTYKTDPRLGGDEGFRALIQNGQRMGFRMMPMFGTNSANKTLPNFSHFANATTDKVDGNAFDLDWVDWDNDRSNEGWSPFMNLGVDSWREWLFQRISSVIDQFKVDAYFLDIVGGWMNNTKGDMYEGTVRLVKDLSAKYPHVLAVGEMHYDALLSCIPMYQVSGPSAYPEAFSKYARAFEHLSRPAPGRGSTGVHEAGFGKFSPELSKNPLTIPTITVVDDTFDKHRDLMAQVIAEAKQRAGIP